MNQGNLQAVGTKQKSVIIECGKNLLKAAVKSLTTTENILLDVYLFEETSIVVQNKLKSPFVLCKPTENQQSLSTSPRCFDFVSTNAQHAQLVHVINTSWHILYNQQPS